MELSVKRVIEGWITNFLMLAIIYLYCRFLSNNIFNVSTDFLFFCSIPFMIWLASVLDDLIVERYVRCGDIMTKYLVHERVENYIKMRKRLTK